MISDAVIRFVFWLISLVLSWIPVIPVPAWVGDVSSGLAVMFQAVNTMGAWVPTNLLFTVAGLVLICVLAGLGIKVARSLVSYFLAGGGSSG